MAAKSTKNPPRKTPAKKVPKQGTQKTGEIVPALPDARGCEFEVVVDAPTFMPPEVLEKIETVEVTIGNMGAMTDEDFINEIRGFVADAAKYCQLTETYSSMALVCAWGCGTMLNATKERLGHRAFGKWRKENFADSGFSERSSTRYMQLASRCGDIRAKLESGSSLRQAYIAYGILADTSSADEPGAEKEKSHPTAVLLTGVRNFQKNLRLFATTLDRFDKSKGKLSSEDKMELRLMKDEISGFTDRILKLLP